MASYIYTPSFRSNEAVPLISSAEKTEIRAIIAASTHQTLPVSELAVVCLQSVVRVLSKSETHLVSCGGLVGGGHGDLRCWCW